MPDPTNPQSRMRVKMGAIEIEFEGSENFLKEELPDLLEAVSKLYNETGASEATPENTAPASPDPGSSGGVQLTTGSIAAALQCKTGSDLATAAAAHLAIVKGKGTFTRKELADEMKSATGYYKSTYSGGNLTKYLKTLVSGGTLAENAKDTYSLKASEKANLEKKLGQS